MTGSSLLPDEYVGGSASRPVMSPFNDALSLLTKLDRALARIGWTEHGEWLDTIRSDIRASAVAAVGIDPEPYDDGPIEERFPAGTRLRWVQTEGLSFRHHAGYPPPLATIVRWSPSWTPGDVAPQPKEFWNDRLEVLFDGDDEVTSFNAYVLVSSFAKVTDERRIPAVSEAPL